MLAMATTQTTAAAEAQRSTGDRKNSYTRWPMVLRSGAASRRAITRSAMLKQNIEAAGVPDVKAVWAPECGGSRLLLAVAIQQRYPGHAVQAGQIACQCHTGAYGGGWGGGGPDGLGVGGSAASCGRGWGWAPFWAQGVEREGGVGVGAKGA